MARLRVRQAILRPRGTLALSSASRKVLRMSRLRLLLPVRAPSALSTPHLRAESALASDRPTPIPCRSSRKDSVKQHMRRRHPNSPGVHIRTLPPNVGPAARSRQSSNSSLEYDPSPPPDLLPVNPALLHHPHVDVPAFSAPLYYAEPSPDSWHL